MNAALLKPYSLEEVTIVLFHMKPHKAPGPDGIYPFFFQKYWHMLSNDVVQFMNEFFHGSTPSNAVTDAAVVLIPKVQNPKAMSEFRPISLCNVLCKISLKTMANRLKELLPSIISKSQSAFIQNRLITDNAIVAIKMFHTMKKRSKGRRGSVSIKLDMSKTYDRVEWDFLMDVLGRMGFESSWISQVMRCVQGAVYSFKINGKIRGRVLSSRGLRQGDPISPYLFIIVAKALSYLINYEIGMGTLHGIGASRNGPKISHDCLLFARATNDECRKIVQILKSYELASGQKVNFDKSEVTFSRGSQVIDK